MVDLFYTLGRLKILPPLTNPLKEGSALVSSELEVHSGCSSIHLASIGPWMALPFMRER